MDKIKKTGAKLAGSQKVRFGLVGMINTFVDFAVLNILVGVAGLTLVPSNIASTTVAMFVSFGLNKKTVFKDSSGHRLRQIFLFFAATLTGIWLVQTSVMFGAYQILDQLTTWHPALLLNISKVIGICVGLVWNYMWYSRVVFMKPLV